MQDFLNQFESQGFCLFRHFLSADDCAALRKEIEQLSEQHQLKKAGIGKDAGKHIDESQRGDFIRWIERESAHPSAKRFFEALDEIIIQFNRNFYLGLRSFECHYTRYPAGTFYRKHVDRHRGVSHRVVSFVLYLNENWTASDGGILRIYHDNGSHTDILPEIGSLVLFLSEKEHEVLITHRTRMSVTGWIKNADPF